MIDFTLRSVKIAFHTKSILTPAEKAQLRMLKEFGAYCRAVMRHSIKRARGPGHHADKGKPPLAHDGGAINFKETIFFVADTRSKNVVIGGVLLSGTKANGDPVPGILEHGGDKLGAARLHGKGVNPHAARAVQAHPYARPAFDLTIQRKLPGLIRGGILREA